MDLWNFGFKMFTMLLIATPFFVGGIYGLIVEDFPVWAALVILGVALITGAYLTLVIGFPAPPLWKGKTCWPPATRP